MIYVTINEKGGVGKSTVALHFLTSYLLSRNPSEKKASVFEFDAHNDTSKEVESDHSIQVETIRMDEMSREKGLAKVQFDTMSGDVILDVGGSQNTDEFLNMLEDTALGDEMIFIIPEANKRPRGAENTVNRIKKIIDNPRIILLLNGFTDEDKVEQEFIFLYGDTELGIKKSFLADDKEIEIAWIPRCDKALGMADLDSVGLWSKGSFFRTFGKLSTKEKVVKWGGAGKECDKDTFVQKSGELTASRVAYKAIESSNSLFDALDKLSEL